MRAHLSEASLAAAAAALLAMVGATAIAGCAHERTGEAETTAAPVAVAPRTTSTMAPAPAPADTAPASSREHGAAPVDEDGTPAVPGLGTPTQPGGQYGNGTAGTSSDTHKGTWRAGAGDRDPRPLPPAPTP